MLTLSTALIWVIRCRSVGLAVIRLEIRIEDARLPSYAGSSAHRGGIEEHQ